MFGVSPAEGGRNTRKPPPHRRVVSVRDPHLVIPLEWTRRSLLPGGSIIVVSNNVFYRETFLFAERLSTTPGSPSRVATTESGANEMNQADPAALSKSR